MKNSATTASSELLQKDARINELERYAKLLESVELVSYVRLFGNLTKSSVTTTKSGRTADSIICLCGTSLYLQLKTKNLPVDLLSLFIHHLHT